VYLEELAQEVVTRRELAGDLAGEGQGDGRELGEDGVEAGAIDHRDRRPRSRHDREWLHVAGDDREGAEPIAGRHPRVQVEVAFGDIDVDRAVDHDRQARLGGGIAPCGDVERDDLEAPRDPRHLVGPQVLEDRQLGKHRFER